MQQGRVLRIGRASGEHEDDDPDQGPERHTVFYLFGPTTATQRRAIHSRAASVSAKKLSRSLPSTSR